MCSGSSPPYLLVIVCSALQNFEARYTIRHSWAQDQHKIKNVKVAFLVGQRLNETLQVRQCVSASVLSQNYKREFQDKLTAESEMYGDIIQESFIDSYANLRGVVKIEIEIL